MPSQVRIISPRNSREWDELVRAAPQGAEHTYGGVVTQERADRVRRCIRTAAKHLGLGAKVYWQPCRSPGKCPFGADCGWHVSYTLYDLDAAREYKSRQANTPR